MKKIIVLSFALFALCSVSFAQSRTTQQVDYQESSARNIEPEQSVVIAPLLADLQVVSDRITYTEKEAFANYKVTLAIEKSIPAFKQIALSRAARAHNADVIVGAVIDVITNQDGFLEITVSGYPARYANFRNATRDDLELVAEAKLIKGYKDGDILSKPDKKADLLEVKIEK